MKTRRGTPRVVNKEFPAALLAIQKAKVERVTVLCQQVGRGKKITIAGKYLRSVASSSRRVRDYYPARGGSEPKTVSEI